MHLGLAPLLDLADGMAEVQQTLGGMNQRIKLTPSVKPHPSSFRTSKLPGSFPTGGSGPAKGIGKGRWKKVMLVARTTTHITVSA
jgi:hypothetical protein